MTPLETTSPAEVEKMIQQMAESIKSLLGADTSDAKMLGIRTGGVMVARKLHAALQLPDAVSYTHLTLPTIYSV